MNFEKARKIANTLIPIGMVIAIISVVLLPKDSPAYLSGSLIGIFIIIISISICVIWCKCPHCGKRIFFKVLSIKRCPHCNKLLSKPPKGKNKYGEKSSNSPRLR